MVLYFLLKILMQKQLQKLAKCILTKQLCLLINILKIEKKILGKLLLKNLLIKVIFSEKNTEKLKILKYTIYGLKDLFKCHLIKKMN